jgi:type II secretory pathway pseudopilin PulG
MQPNNVRVGAPNQQQQSQKQQSQKQQSAAYQQVQNSQQQEKQALPFTKLSISDAISLITLRLGRVEQWVIDTENENEENGGNVGSSGSLNLPDNSKIIDSSILNNIISRLDSLEKREPGTNSLEEITKISESVTKLTEQITKIIDEGNKQSLIISKHTEQVFKFDRDLVETKDLLKTFMIRYDMFASETNNKFADYELALSELEKNVQPVEDTPLDTPVDGTNINDIDTSDLSNEIASTIMSVDLKNIIKQELAASSN